VTDEAELIVRTGLCFDVDRVAALIQSTTPADDGSKYSAVVVTDPPDERPTRAVLNEPFRATYLEELLSALPFRYGLTRLLSIPPQRSYPVHRDSSMRYHLALETHPFAYIIYPTLNRIYHIPNDGYLYRMDATRPHAAINCGPLSRTHLVIVAPEPAIERAACPQDPTREEEH